MQGMKTITSPRFSEHAPKCYVR